MSQWGVSSEYGTLLSVLLYCPGEDIGNHPHPEAVLHLAPISQTALLHEFDALITTLEALGIKVNLIDDTPITADRNYRFNMMYCRDLFLMTPFGAIVANMASSIRSAEQLYAVRSLEGLGCKILHTVSGAGRFEGADAIWLGDDLLLIGVGNRTNLEGFNQIAKLLEPYGITCMAGPSYQTRTQHLLGSVQIIDRDLALVRHALVDPEIVDILKRHGFATVDIDESPEVVGRQAMNIVTVAPRTVLMTNNCPETGRLYRDAGITIAAELELTQLLAGAGGLACASGIVARAAV